MALLDGDRFAGKFRKGAHDTTSPRDLMRRMVKEELLRFDGTKLFPERVAYTAKYPLSPLEDELYQRVSDYVRDGMNRADRIANTAGLTDVAERYGIEHNAPKHLAEVEAHARVDATRAAVEKRLDAEVRYWDAQALKLKDQELAGKRNARLNSARARQRADEAAERLERRTAELARERKLSARQPRVVGGALVVPAGLLAERLGSGPVPPDLGAKETERVDRLAVDAVLAAEAALGRTAREMPHNNKGYDVETRHGVDGDLVFVEVKGRIRGAEDFNISASQILCALNNRDHHILALVEVAGDDATTVRYLYDPFTGRAEPGFAENFRNLEWQEFWALATPPR